MSLIKIINLGIFILCVLTACNKTDDKENLSKQIINHSDKLIITDSFDKQNPAWKSYQGHWLVKNGVLLQDSKNNSFPVILREDNIFSNVDIRVQFKPISGDIDASAGVVFRATDEDNYYIVRANALENNFRLYTFIDGYRQQLASATVTPPAPNEWHSMRVVAQNDHIQVYLNDKLAIDFHDTTFSKGYVGLWTKADSVTAFDNFKVR